MTIADRDNLLIEMDTSNKKQGPNILVTGTPGVGKSATASLLCTQAEGMRHLDVSSLISQKKLYDEWDDERGCSIFDEDKARDDVDD